MRFSCKGCTKRHVGCHSTCEKYIAEKAENDKIKELNFRYHQNEFFLNSNGTLYSGKISRRKNHNEQ